MLVSPFSYVSMMCLFGSSFGSAEVAVVTKQRIDGSHILVRNLSY